MYFVDERLGKRFRTLLDHSSDGTGESIPKAVRTGQNIKGAYRSVSNERVMMRISRGLSTFRNLSPYNALAGAFPGKHRCIRMLDPFHHD
jgi:hypothetical protein